MVGTKPFLSQDVCVPYFGDFWLAPQLFRDLVVHYYYVSRFTDNKKAHIWSRLCGQIHTRPTPGLELRPDFVPAGSGVLAARCDVAILYRAATSW